MFLGRREGERSFEVSERQAGAEGDRFLTDLRDFGGLPRRLMNFVARFVCRCAKVGICAG